MVLAFSVNIQRYQGARRAFEGVWYVIETGLE